MFSLNAKSMIQQQSVSVNMTKDTMLDYFLKEIASHSKDCMCSKCTDNTDQAKEDNEAYADRRRENYESNFISQFTD